jgi:glycosyltransferase involved in cell wall biosynthesis
VPEESVSLSETGPLRIFGLARLVPKKGFDTLLEALAKLDKADQKKTPFFCTLAGDGPERERLAELALHLGISDRVRFLGEVPNSAVPSLLRASDVMILPCKVDARGDRDGIPVALMEAMAAGVPVVSGDLPTIRELITDRVHGLLVPPGDAEALAGVLGELAAQPTLRVALGVAGKNRVKEEFSSEKNLVRLMRCFSDKKMP